MTSIYLVCFHSEKRENLDGCKRQYRAVEMAIRNGEWPYDNGDDPSFYVARRGGLLTWGVCRQDLRNAIAKGSILVFFSFTPLKNSQALYRLCAAGTVTEKINHCAIHRDDRFSPFRQLYINGLIRPEDDGWRYDETDRPSSHRHRDWLWRISDHRGTTRKRFDKKYAGIYRDGSFPDSAVARGNLRLGRNYIVLSTPPDRAFISPDPPEVAIAVKERHEKWIDQELQALTVGTAASLLKNRRSYLRAINSSGRNVHRWIRFDMPTDIAVEWRDTLIDVLKEASERRNKRTTSRPRVVPD